VRTLAESTCGTRTSGSREASATKWPVFGLLFLVVGLLISFASFAPIFQGVYQGAAGTGFLGGIFVGIGLLAIILGRNR